MKIAINMLIYMLVLFLVSARNLEAAAFGGETLAATLSKLLEQSTQVSSLKTTIEETDDDVQTLQTKVASMETLVESYSSILSHVLGNSNDIREIIKSLEALKYNNSTKSTPEHTISLLNHILQNTNNLNELGKTVVKIKDENRKHVKKQLATDESILDMQLHVTKQTNATLQQFQGQSNDLHALRNEFTQYKFDSQEMEEMKSQMIIFRNSLQSLNKSNIELHQENTLLANALDVLNVSNIDVQDKLMVNMSEVQSTMSEVKDNLETHVDQKDIHFKRDNTVGDDSKFYWIGYKNGEAGFTWEDGTSLSFTPDWHAGHAVQTCARILSRKYEEKWQKVPCTRRDIYTRFICEA